MGRIRQRKPGTASATSASSANARQQRGDQPQPARESMADHRTSVAGAITTGKAKRSNATEVAIPGFLPSHSALQRGLVGATEWRMRANAACRRF
jgi:hypothetical protein